MEPIAVARTVPAAGLAPAYVRFPPVSEERYIPAEIAVVLVGEVVTNAWTGPEVTTKAFVPVL
jgi:hypothetical protein